MSILLLTAGSPPFTTHAESFIIFYHRDTTAQCNNCLQRSLNWDGNRVPLSFIIDIQLPSATACRDHWTELYILHRESDSKMLRFNSKCHSFTNIWWLKIDVWMLLWSWSLVHYKSISSFSFAGAGERGTPFVDYSGRFLPEGVLFSGRRHIKGKGFHLFKYTKG